MAWLTILPVAQAASVVGVYGLSLVAVAVAAMPGSAGGAGTGFAAAWCRRGNGGSRCRFRLPSGAQGACVLPAIRPKWLTV